MTSGEENGGPQPPVVESKNGNGVDNMAFQEASNAAEENKNGQTNAGPLAATIPEEGGDAVAAEPRKKKNFCLEFFDPTLALACIEVVRRKRENHKHVLIWLFILSYIVIAGTVQGNIFLLVSRSLSSPSIYRGTGLPLSIRAASVELGWSRSLLLHHLLDSSYTDW